MASLTLTILQGLVRDLVGDPSSNGTGANTYSDAMVTDAINFAIQDLCTKMEYTYREAIVSTPSPYYPMPLSNASPTAQDYLIIKRVYDAPHAVQNGLPTLNELLKTTFAEEDLKNYQWRNNVGMSNVRVRWALEDGETIYIIPHPTTGNDLVSDESVYSIVVGYIQQPTVLASGGDTVDVRIPFPVQIYLKYLAAAWLKQLAGQDEQDQNMAKEWQALAYAEIGYKG